MNGDSLLNNSGCKQPVKTQENKTVFNSGDTLCPAPCARRSAPVQPENAALIILPIMFLRSHDEFSAPGLLAGKSEKPGH
ncbi:hypothetical protein C0Q74_17525 [Klebsiella pneumoniae]|nr:hypothetical protein [Klebsiella pneumoniae]